MTGLNGTIRIGIGGWSFKPWRETFYPPEIKAAAELAYASRQMSSIEVNATFYRTQTRATFQRWHDEAPDGFVFSVKGPRAATYPNDPDRQADAVARFLDSGLTALGPRLGPILWQFAPTRKFDRDHIAAFLGLLPATHDGVALRHAIELRHPTATDPALLDILAEHGVALAAIERPDEPPRLHRTADFFYVRLEASEDDEPNGYPSEAVAAWAETLTRLAAGQPSSSGAEHAPHDVFCYVISGAKHRNPAAARALIAALGHT